MKLDKLTPQETVAELDRFIVGQDAAKRAVAIALRNRWRRQQLDETLREEVLPKNILTIGPTGCGKTEIARRLAKLAQARLRLGKTFLLCFAIAIEAWFLFQSILSLIYLNLKNANFRCIGAVVSGPFFTIAL